MSSRKTSGVVLRSMDLGESDTLVTFYTRDYGLARIAVSGSKKTTSFKSGLLQKFSWNELEYFQGEGLGQLNKLASKHSFQALRQNLKKMSYGSYVLEFYYLAGTAQPDAALFQHLIATLYQLEEAREDQDFALIHLVFRLLMLEYLGFSLRLAEESGWKEENYPPRKLAFSIPEGGLVLAEDISRGNYSGENSQAQATSADNYPEDNLSAENPQAESPKNENPKTENLQDENSQDENFLAEKTIAITGEVYQILKIIKNKGYNLPSGLKISGSARKKINRILDEFIAYHLDLNLRSRRFLDMF